MPPFEDPVRRIERNIHKDASGCWLWRGAIRSGYGLIHVSRPKRANVYVHRFMFELHHRPLRADELVMHTCDVKLCCNPAHLEAGTKTTNAIDAVRKGRPMGCNRTTITPQAVDHIRVGWALGLSIKALARECGLSRSTVTKIARGEWTHAMKMRESA